MIDFLINTLEPLGYPIIRQGSMTENEKYPDTFFTFWNNDTFDDIYYDNKSLKEVWDFDLNCYSSDPNKVYSELEAAIKLLKNVGFVISGKGYDVASDEPTHTGRGVNAIYAKEVI